MPNFTYSARDQRGIVQTGYLDALDEDDAVAMLQRRGLLVTSISRKDLTRSPIFGRRTAAQRMHGRVTTDDQVLLCQQLSTMIEAGVPLLKSLEVVASQCESRTLMLALEAVHHDVEAGRSFRDALARHPAVFSRLWLNLVETGEASGHLAQALQQLARHFELAQHLENQAKTALTYPAFLMVAIVGVMAIFVYFIIPKFVPVFESSGIQMPLLTRVIILASKLAQRYFVVLLAAAIGSWILLWRYLRTEPGRWMRDRVLLSTPLFRTLFTYIQLAEFSRGLSTLLESGVPLLSGLEILEGTATNKFYGKAIGHVRSSVKEGKSMVEPMAETGMFPPITIQMIQVGEEVGELGTMAGRIATYYEERVETFISRMTRLFEPIAIVIVAVVVLVVVLSIFLPIFQLAGGLKA